MTYTSGGIIKWISGLLSAAIDRIANRVQKQQQKLSGNKEKRLVDRQLRSTVTCLINTGDLRKENKGETRRFWR